ncbi:hypothetical protein [Actinocrispum sp. NPDC049592]|uniref:hypothetical protein n=1 Tax=Actinocrispum sp. NPDC049592 TaxID=3154835 RepID=UPI00342E1745
MTGWVGRRLVGVGLGLVGAVLVLVATFFPLFSGSVGNGRLRITLTATPWGFKAAGTGATQVGAIPVNAYPMIVSVVLLLVGTVTAFVAARTDPTPLSRRASVVLMAVGASFTSATALTVGLEAVSWEDSFRPTGTGVRITDAALGLGFWGLILGAVVGIAGAIVTALPARPVDPPTPPFGFPLPETGFTAPETPAEPG